MGGGPLCAAVSYIRSDVRYNSVLGHATMYIHISQKRVQENGVGVVDKHAVPLRSNSEKRRPRGPLAQYCAPGGIASHWWGSEKYVLSRYPYNGPLYEFIARLESRRHASGRRFAPVAHVREVIEISAHLESFAERLF